MPRVLNLGNVSQILPAYKPGNALELNAAMVGIGPGGLFVALEEMVDRFLGSRLDLTLFRKVNGMWLPNPQLYRCNGLRREGDSFTILAQPERTDTLDQLSGVRLSPNDAPSIASIQGSQCGVEYTGIWLAKGSAYRTEDVLLREAS